MEVIYLSMKAYVEDIFTHLNTMAKRIRFFVSLLKNQSSSIVEADMKSNL